jgi:hypothetical protein
MSEVLKFKRPSSSKGKPPTLDDIFGHDASYLRFIAQWRAARTTAKELG